MIIFSYFFTQRHTTLYVLFKNIIFSTIIFTRKSAN